ncbi:recombinase [Streptomyces sp. NPDC047079]|uniref:recombinase n=1 Tax=Streptomyces sp. NPDC047079 TaxID=3154607 RepID=UPI0033D2B49A
MASFGTEPSAPPRPAGRAAARLRQPPHRQAVPQKDLLLRRKRAQEEHWLGEVEGIDSTLTFLRAKQAEAARLTKRPTTDLGNPRPRPEESQ